MRKIDYSLLDRDDISSTMFHARFGDWIPPLPGASDHIVSVGGTSSDGGTWVSCRFFPHEKSSPSILHFHGNGDGTSIFRCQEYKGGSHFDRDRGLFLYFSIAPVTFRKL